MPKITRRGLIKRLALLAPTLAAGSALSIPPKKHETWSYDTGKEAFYFIGRLHGAPDYYKQYLYPADPETEFAEAVDAIFNEDTSPYLDPELDQLGIWQKISEGKADNLMELDGPTFKYCREKGIPLFMGDLSFKSNTGLELMTNLVSVLEVFTGFATAFRDTPRSTRRRVLLGGLGLGVGIWGASMPIVQALDKEGGPKNLQDSDTLIKRDIEATLADKIHPEHFPVLMRNSLWAKKLLFIGGQLKERGIKHPKIGIIAGFGHRYLDYFLRHPMEIDSVISMYSKTTEALIRSNEYAYGILEVNLHQGSFSKQFLRVPELQKTFVEKESVSTEIKG